MAATSNEIFCSYAHEDRAFIEDFRKHLRLMEREDLISTWYDASISPGQPWRSEVEQHLQSANLILLLISPDFLNSDFCMDVELPLALERSQRKEALVIPIILRPVDWEDASFAHLQALPQNGKPISTWQDQDAAFKQVAEAIKRCIREQAVPATTKCQLLNLPFRRNPIFTGREEVLEKLHAALQQHRTTALVQAIS
ncbi:MAG TPA: toll/interleukin-1 receptor domain-containing protein, partial [Ktedonobacteraceae bacterium]